jgi:ATP-binding cassette subfamily F protein 3
MEEIAPAHVDSPFRFSFFVPEKNPNPLIRLEQAGAGYAGQEVFQRAELAISPGDRIGLLGRNGAGKSTLIKLLSGALQPSSGRVSTAQDLRVGYFAQHQLEQLDPNASPLLHLQRLDGDASEQSLRDFLGGFGFTGDRALDPVAPFSGGEKARLALALVVYLKPNLLLLDEPTNHLDLEMRLALGNALQAFSGAMVIVSHDRYLLRITTDQLWLVHGGKIEPFDGDLDTYPAWLAEQRRAETTPQQPEAPSQNSAAMKKARKRSQAEQRKKLQPLRARIRHLERDLEGCREENEEIERALTENHLYAAENKESLKEILAKKASNDQKIVLLEDEWIEKCEQLEAALEEEKD